MAAATKHALLGLVDQAVAEGFTPQAACRVLQVGERRVNRWQARRAASTLADRPAGGGAVHGLLDEEVEAILELAEEWGEIDRSHRKLAHRGSRLGRVWVSPASVYRVLAAHDLVLPKPAGRAPVQGTPWPEWITYRPNQVWGWDVTHFGRCQAAPCAFAIIDLVSRKWLATLLSAEETSTQVQVVFGAALEAEGLAELVAARQDGRVDLARDDPSRPLLLAVSDNGPQMTSGSTREFLALCSIVQHFGRPHTPTDQAPIESFFGHVKGEWPHLERIRDPEQLRAELEVVRAHYNTVRLHAGIGYVTPDDEHSGRGAQIRTARRQGLEWARHRRITYHRKHGKETRP
ncbi:MAG: integrase core domain-containing protein [Actinomycetota bacterium]|nr:integrase core domain-containing protein [Actinomycetota bacterium]